MNYVDEEIKDRCSILMYEKMKTSTQCTSYEKDQKIFPFGFALTFIIKSVTGVIKS